MCIFTIMKWERDLRRLVESDISRYFRVILSGFYGWQVALDSPPFRSHLRRHRPVSSKHRRRPWINRRANYRHLITKKNGSLIFPTCLSFLSILKIASWFLSNTLRLFVKTWERDREIKNVTVEIWNIGFFFWSCMSTWRNCNTLHVVTVLESVVLAHSFTHPWS